jgi:hypothetical protein
MMCKMTQLEEQAYNWAINQKYPSVAARYALILAQYIKRQRVEKERKQGDPVQAPKKGSLNDM